MGGSPAAKAKSLLTSAASVSALSSVSSETRRPLPILPHDSVVDSPARHEVFELSSGVDYSIASQELHRQIDELYDMRQAGPAMPKPAAAASDTLKKKIINKTLRRDEPPAKAPEEPLYPTLRKDETGDYSEPPPMTADQTYGTYSTPSVSADQMVRDNNNKHLF